ncbi:MAG: hypothetical protein KKC80_03985 [Candidatus Margulisbacteria bacterium]|nr:hypothetical protein [Candidatus Margulisiibacteriota bacterium]MBU1616719.1 hypothetical protein [Candidatus Margulisiibacteriota bacterium]
MASGISKGIQTSQLNYIEKLADKYLKYSLPDEIAIDPETAILGYVYFQKKTDNYPYHLRLSVGGQTYLFKFKIDKASGTTTQDKELKKYFENQ